MHPAPMNASGCALKSDEFSGITSEIKSVVFSSAPEICAFPAAFTFSISADCAPENEMKIEAAININISFFIMSSVQ